MKFIIKASLFSAGNVFLLLFSNALLLKDSTVLAENKIFKNSDNCTACSELDVAPGGEKETVHGSNGNSNPFAKYIFGLPPIPIDPVIPGVKLDDEFETWRPPLEVDDEQLLNWNVIFSGFEFENRPIFIVRYRRGVHDGHKPHDLASNSTEILEKKFRYQAYAALKAHKIQFTPEKPVHHHVFITDFIDINSHWSFFRDRQRIVRLIRFAGKYRQFHEKYTARNVVINVSPAVEIFLNLLRGLIRRRLHQFEIYGTDKGKWIPALQRQFPRDQLPEKYGGLKGHVPVKFYFDQ